VAVIKNYGLRWVRDKVEWGGRGVKGELLGVPRSARSSSAVDFREQIGVYVLYEPGFVPIYVGQAGFGRGTLFSRLKVHARDHLRDRWSHFSWFGFRKVNDSGSLHASQEASARTSITYGDALDEIEGILIQVLEPRLNRQGASWQDSAEEYIQEGRPSEADAIEEIRRSVDGIAARLDELAKQIAKNA
jgi:hypothetical protein